MTEIKDVRDPKKENNSEWKEGDNTAEWNYKGSHKITTLLEALSYCDVDLAVWKVHTHSIKHNWWDMSYKNSETTVGKTTNFQVTIKIQFKRIDDSILDMIEVKEDVIRSIKNESISVPETVRNVAVKGNHLL